MRGMGAKKAVVVGLTFLDNIFFDIDRFPELGTESFAKGHAVTAGGIAITAVNLARLGVPTTLVTSLGDDVFGRFLRERLAEAGLSSCGSHPGRPHEPERGDRRGGRPRISNCSRRAVR